MKVKVDDNLCIGCGVCMNICQEVFGYNDENKSEVKINEVFTAELQEKVKEAAEICPVDAIII